MINRVDHAARWRVMFKGPRDRRWITLGSAGSMDQAERWLLRCHAGSGDYRIEKPKESDQKGG